MDLSAAPYKVMVKWPCIWCMVTQKDIIGDKVVGYWSVEHTTTIWDMFLGAFRNSTGGVNDRSDVAQIEEKEHGKDLLR